MHRTFAFCHPTSRLLIVLLLVFGLSTGCSTWSDDDATTTAETSSQTLQASDDADAAQVDFPGAIRKVVEDVKPAVVQITNLQVQLDQFNQPASVPAGVGSGVIYDAEGYILTNNHVIEGAQQLQATLPDGRTFPATLVGADPRTDLAVVQIESEDLPVAALGDSTQLQVGEWVIAIGNALGLPGGPTVTAGVISALARSVQEPGDSSRSGTHLFDLVQTDAAINPGNSGGPLINLAGEVIGINTLAIVQAAPGVRAEGIGFALSISSVKPLADEIVSNGSVTHAYLGIQTIPLTPAIAAQLGVQAEAGAVVVAVDPGSPADSAGLSRGDVITAFDDTELVAESDLPRELSESEPGDEITLTIERGGTAEEVRVTLGALPGQ